MCNCGFFRKLFETALAAWFALSIGLVLFYRFVPVRVTPLMLIRKAEAAREGRNLAIRQEWTPLEDISPNLINSVIESEDARFYTHHGFDADAIMNAWLLNKRFGCIMFGGSTISQQTAKNVFCTPYRTWTRKAFEAYFTVLIELFWSKDRIMEVYLNIVELGDGIFGAEAAADFYYSTSASHLSPSNSSYLTFLLPCPRDFLLESIQ